jgi:hypothetical protein
LEKPYRYSNQNGGKAPSEKIKKGRATVGRVVRRGGKRETKRGAASSLTDNDYLASPSLQECIDSNLSSDVARRRCASVIVINERLIDVSYNNPIRIISQVEVGMDQSQEGAAPELFLEPRDGWRIAE